MPELQAEPVYHDRQATTFHVLKREDYLWGNKVVAIQFRGGRYGVVGDDNYYFFATGKHTYEIRKVMGSTTQFTRNTVGQIFANMLFLD